MITFIWIIHMPRKKRKKAKEQDLSNKNIPSENLCNHLQKEVKPSTATLNLQCNQLSDDAMNQLALFLNRSNITALDISYNLINSELKELFNLILKKLKHLSVNNNPLINESLTINSFNKLKCLSMHGCEINLTGVRKLSSALKNSSLEFLNIADNFLGSSGFKLLFKNIPNTLKHLDVSNNEIDDKCLTVFTEKSNNLELLNLSLNEFSTEGLRSLFSQVPMHLSLNISSMRITLVELMSFINPSRIPKTLCLEHQKNLTKIYINEELKEKMPQIVNNTISEYISSAEIIKTHYM